MPEARPASTDAPEVRDPVTTDEVTTDEVTTDEVATDEVTTDEVATDEVTTEADGDMTPRAEDVAAMAPEPALEPTPEAVPPYAEPAGRRSSLGELLRRVFAVAFGVAQALLLFRVAILALNPVTDNPLALLVLAAAAVVEAPFRGMFPVDQVTVGLSGVIDVTAFVAVLGWTLLQGLLLAMTQSLRTAGPLAHTGFADTTRRLVVRVAGIIQALLVLRIGVALAGADPAYALTQGLDLITRPIVAPFMGAFPAQQSLALGSQVDLAAIAALVAVTVAEAVLMAVLGLVSDQRPAAELVPQVTRAEPATDLGHAHAPGA